MKPRVFSLLIVSLFIASCKKEQQSTLAVAKTTDSVTVKKDSVEGEPKPVFGYRFVITGDFDGDGKTENLVEHYYSRRDKKEVCKFYDNVDANTDVLDLVIAKQPYSFAVSDNKNIDTLRISKEKQLYGIAYLKNEGDLNGDGTDEISYAVSYANFTTRNMYYIMTYKEGRWKQLGGFNISDSQLPELPEEGDIDKGLKAFPGLIKKLGNGKVEVEYTNSDAERVKTTVNLGGSK